MSLSSEKVRPGAWVIGVEVSAGAPGEPGSWKSVIRERGGEGRTYELSGEAAKTSRDQLELYAVIASLNRLRENASQLSCCRF